MEVRWTEHAFRDLDGIHSYIRTDSPNIAREVAKRLWEAVLVLREFPDSGRVVPERAVPTLPPPGRA